MSAGLITAHCKIARAAQRLKDNPDAFRELTDALALIELELPVWQVLKLRSTGDTPAGVSSGEVKRNNGDSHPNCGINCC